MRLVKWAGGKTKLIPALKPFIDRAFTHYHEPFLGGGSVFQYIASNRMLESVELADKNEELMNVYRVVKDKPTPLIEALRVHEKNHSKDYFYLIRGLDRLDQEFDDISCAARTIYLNRTCFNGLYRVNKKGYFNVPIGSYKNPKIAIEGKIQHWNMLLNHCDVQLKAEPFSQNSIGENLEGHLIYLDPPYEGLYGGYTLGGFTVRHHKDLAEILGLIDSRGGMFVLNNSDNRFTREIYKDWHIYDHSQVSVINPKKPSKIKELIVTNFFV